MDGCGNHHGDTPLHIKILVKIKNFDLSNATLIMCMNFLSEIKSQTITTSLQKTIITKQIVNNFKKIS